jgi:hypothetical protein
MGPLSLSMLGEMLPRFTAAPEETFLKTLISSEENPRRIYLVLLYAT